MHAIKKIYTIAFLLAAALPMLRAQRITISDPLTVRNDYGYELVGRMRDRFLIFRDKADEFEIQAFDPQMHLSWSRRLEDIDKRGVQILAVIGGKNDFSIVFRVQRRSVTTVRLHKYDPGANLIDSTVIKNYGVRTFEPPVVDIARSEDRNCLAVFNTATRGSLEITSFRIDKMQVLWDKTLEFDQDYLESSVKGIVLSNDGDMFVANEYNNRKGKIGEHSFRIVHITAPGDHLYNIPLTEFLTTDVKFTVDNANRALTAVGLYGDKTRDRTIGVFYLRQPFNSDAHVLRYTAFDEKFTSILRRKDIDEAYKGLNDADVSQVVLRQDGGALLIAERHHEIQRGASAGRGFFRDGVRMVIDFYFDDLFIVALNPDGSVHWNTVLHKKQYSQDDEGIFSSYFCMRTPDQLHFLFNDEVKYENTCSEYLVSTGGDFDRNSLLNTVGLSLRLRFRDGMQISATECVVPSEFRNRLRLVYLRY